MGKPGETTAHDAVPSPSDVQNCDRIGPTARLEREQETVGRRFPCDQKQQEHRSPHIQLWDVQRGAREWGERGTKLLQS